MRIQSTLREAREFVFRNRERGVRCPCCGQFAKIYRRKLNSGMARSLISMYQIAGTDWVHLPTQLSARSREEGKLRYWGLVEEEDVVRPDGGRAGWWRVTMKGKRFVLDSLLVPKHACVYNGQLLELDDTEMISVREALGSKFNYEELMGE